MTKSNDEILKLLRRKADELGRRPTLGDIQADSELRNGLFRKRFGSLNKAIDLALELPTALVQRPRKEKDELLLAMHNVVKKLGYMPSRIQVDNHPDLEDSSVYESIFGSWKSFVSYYNCRYPSAKIFKPSRDCLILSLQLKAKELPSGTIITRMDVSDDPRMPSVFAYAAEFGKFTTALVEAKLPTRVSKSPSEKVLITLLRNKAAELGRRPTQQDVSSDKSLPSPTAYYKFFKTSWARILEIAGLDQIPTKRELPSDEKLFVKRTEAIKDLQAEAERLGHTPNYTELRKSTVLTHYPSYYSNLFGSYSEAISAAGLPPLPERCPVSNEELIVALRHKAEELGHRPRIRDVINDGDMYSVELYYSRFGRSWPKVLEAAGLNDLPPKNSIPIELKRASAIKELQDEAKRLGRVLKSGDFEHTTKEHHSAGYYKYLFGSFSNALEAAGLEKFQRKKTPEGP